MKLTVTMELEVSSVAFSDEQLRAMLPPPKIDDATGSEILTSGIRDVLRDTVGADVAELIFWEVRAAAHVDGTLYASAHGVDANRMGSGSL